MKYYLVFDIGGTFIKYAIINEQYQIQTKNKVKNTLFKENEDSFFNLLENIFLKVKKNYFISGIAISSLGIVNNKTKIITTYKNDKEFVLNFNNHFDNLPISLQNDANCTLIGEKYFGTLKNVDNAISLTIGTGIGGAILINNKLYCGFNNAAGEVGLMKIFSNQNTSWQDVCSVSALLKQCDYYCKEKDIKKVLVLAKNTSDLDQIFQEWYHNLAVGILNLMYIFAPQKVILSGDITKSENFDAAKITQTIACLDPFMYKNYSNNFIEVATLTHDDNLIGAFCYYMECFKS